MSHLKTETTNNNNNNTTPSTPPPPPSPTSLTPQVNAFYKESMKKNGTLKQITGKIGSAADHVRYKVGQVAEHGGNFLQKSMRGATGTTSRKNLKAIATDTKQKKEIEEQEKKNNHTHILNEYRFKRPTQCSQCNFFIIGFGKQGYLCEECGLSIHLKCLNAFLSTKNHEEMRLMMEMLRKKTDELEDREKKMKKSGSDHSNLGREGLTHSGIKSARATWEILPEHIELGPTLGSGAYGIVYKAKLHGADVAVKVLNVPSLNTTELADFQNEISIMKDIHHPNVVLFMGACTQPGHLMIITEYCGLGSAEDMIYKPVKPLTFLQQLTIAKETALGVNWLHNLTPSFLHRDLKPANILIDNKWTIKIADFGLSTIMSGDSDDGRDEIAGTPFYMAPEILLESHDYDGKVDVYSYAIVLYELFVNLHPYKDCVFESFEEFVQVIATYHQRLELPDTVPEPVRKLIITCWAPSPKERPDFGQIITYVDKLFASVNAPPPPPLNP